MSILRSWVPSALLHAAVFGGLIALVPSRQEVGPQIIFDVFPLDTVSFTQSAPIKNKIKSAGKRETTGAAQVKVQETTLAAPVSAASTSDTHIYLAQVHQKIQSELSRSRIRYRAKGIVMTQLEIHASGELGAATVIQSSGHHQLDRMALTAIKKAAPFDQFTRPLKVKLPVKFE